jgi:hypothetical protein
MDGKMDLGGIKKGDDLDLWDHRLSMGGGGWDVRA